MLAILHTPVLPFHIQVVSDLLRHLASPLVELHQSLSSISSVFFLCCPSICGVWWCVCGLAGQLLHQQMWGYMDVSGVYDWVVNVWVNVCGWKYVYILQS